MRSNTRDMVGFVHANLCAYSPDVKICSRYPRKLLSAMLKAQQDNHYMPSGSLKRSSINVLVGYKPYFIKQTKQALGWVVSKDPSFTNDSRIVWKSGGHPGSSSWIGLNPKKQYGMIILANTRIGDELKITGLKILGQVKN